MLELTAGGSGLYVGLSDPGDDPVVVTIVGWTLEEDALVIDLGGKWTLQGHASDDLIYLDEYRRRRKYAPRFAFQRRDRWRVLERKASAPIPDK